MIESIEKAKIPDKNISKKAKDPAIHYITIKRNARNPELEMEIDKGMFPRQKRDKYEQQYTFETEDLVTRVWNLLHELEQIKVRTFISFGINNTLLIESDVTKIHDEFNRKELAQVQEILAWCYQI